MIFIDVMYLKLPKLDKISQNSVKKFDAISENIPKEINQNVSSTITKSPISTTFKIPSIFKDNNIANIAKSFNKTGNPLKSIVSNIGVKNSSQIFVNNPISSTVNNALKNTSSGTIQKDLLNAGVGKLTGTLSQPLSQISNLPTIGGHVSNISNGVISNLTNSLTSTLEGITNNLTSSLTGRLGNITQGLTGGLSNLTIGLNNRISGMVSSLGNQLTSSINGIVGNLSGNISSAAMSVIGSALGKVPIIGNSLTGIAGNTISSLTGGLTSSISSIFSGGIGNIGELLKGGINSTLNSGIGQLSGLVGNLPGQLNGIVSNAIGQLNGQLGGIAQNALGSLGLGGASAISNVARLASSTYTINSLGSVSDAMSLFGGGLSISGFGGIGGSGANIAQIYLKVLKDVSSKGNRILQAMSKKYYIDQPINYITKTYDDEQLFEMRENWFDTLAKDDLVQSPDEEFDESDWGTAEEDHSPEDYSFSSEDSNINNKFIPDTSFDGESTYKPDLTTDGILDPTQEIVDPDQLRAQLKKEIENSSLNGRIPQDGAKYGITTGSADEWADMMTRLAYTESGYKNGTVGDIGRFETGSRGLFQLSKNDALNYKLQNTPFTHAQLANPTINTKAAVAIAEKLMSKSSTIKGGMGRYWGPIKRDWTPSSVSDSSLQWAKNKAASQPRSINVVVASSQSKPKQEIHPPVNLASNK